MRSAPKAWDRIKSVEVVVNTNHVTFLTNSFSRLISLPTSTIFVSGTSGITAISKYRSVNPVCPCVEVPRKTSLMSSSLLLQQSLVCFIHLTWIVCDIGGKWPYSSCFVRYCFCVYTNHRAVFLRSSHLAFFLPEYVKSIDCVQANDYY